MRFSKLTTKFRATIPKNVRALLKLEVGDSVLFEILDDGTVIIRKATSFDKEYLQVLKHTLNEWESD